MRNTPAPNHGEMAGWMRTRHSARPSTTATTQGRNATPPTITVRTRKGVRDKVLHAIQALYSCASHCVAFEGHLSVSHPIQRGGGRKPHVPLLCAVFIDDLLQDLYRTSDSDGAAVQQPDGMSHPHVGQSYVRDLTCLSVITGGVQHIIDFTYAHSVRWQWMPM
jgi:hypothetical protein